MPHSVLRPAHVPPVTLPAPASLTVQTVALNIAGHREERSWSP